MGSILKTMWHDFIGYEEIKEPPIDHNKTFAEFVTRSEWGAVQPTSVIEFDEMEVPLPVAFVRPTNSRECKTRSSCIREMQKLQKQNMDSGMPDIQHNFYIGGDGHIYEGRGWNYMRTEINEDDFAMHSSISIGVIGRWQVPNKMPPRRMVEAAVHLIKMGMEKGFLREDCFMQSLFAIYTM